LEVLFEGGGLLILNKPAGRATHGPASLEETVRLYLEPRLPPSLSFTPGPLHRLDKPSSGIIVFSTGLEGAQTFSALIRDRKIRKEYLAITDGVIEQEETWADELIRDREAKKTFAAEPRSLNGEAGAGKAPRQTPPLTGEPPLTGAPPLTGEPPLTGTPPLTGEPPLKGESRLKKASTRILPLAKGRAHTLILALIETGRTHQIRAHAAAHGHPLSGDRKYGGAPLKGGFFLHARALEFPAGAFPGLPLRVEAPLPEDFRRSIEILFHHTL
jgi:23S rRNA pseudouridine955/2504/2580 synthase